MHITLLGEFISLSGFAYSLLSAWSSKLDLQAPSCNSHFRSFHLISRSLLGRSDAECVAFSVNSTCILSRCRHHSAFLADAFSPSVTCQYQPKSGACKFQISRTDADSWPVRSHDTNPLSSCHHLRSLLGMG